MTEWFENESFWRRFYPYLFTGERMLSAREEMDDIFALVGFQPRAVLDLCCGPGRHAVEIAKRGIAVTGVDRTAFLLKKAALRAKKEKVRIEWILIKKGKATSWKFHHTLYSGQELKDRLLNAGFSRVKLFGNFKGSQYDNEAQRLVAVAVKS